MYCVKCKRMTDTLNLHHAINKNNRNMLKGTCSLCGTTKNQFVSALDRNCCSNAGFARSVPGAECATTKGGDLTNSINKFTSKLKLPWAKFPGEMHLPGMNFAGPDTNLDERLTSTDMYQDWSKPVDRVDNAIYHHDLAYKYFNDKQTRNLADKMMLEEMNSIQNPIQREINERKIIEPIISAKAKFGLGVTKPGTGISKPGARALGSIRNPGVRALKKNSSKKNITRT